MIDRSYLSAIVELFKVAGLESAQHYVGHITDIMRYTFNYANVYTITTGLVLNEIWLY